MKRYKIENRYTGAILYATEANSLKEAVEKAVKEKISLSVANLSGADLIGAYLSGVNLRGAYLSEADLSGAYLREAYLSVANLSGADLRGANLSGADLSEANLSGANLSEVNLSGAKGAELAIAMTRILPQGTLIGYKKCVGDVIVKVQIPALAKRSHAFGRKCRAEFVKVLHVYGQLQATSTHDKKTIYKKGKIVKCGTWCDDYTQECAGGIHFFITREEAEAY